MNGCGFRMDECKEMGSSAYYLTLQQGIIKFYEIGQQNILRLIFDRTMWVYVDLPRGTSDHGEFRIIKRKIHGTLFTGPVDGVFDRHAEFAVSVPVNVYITLAHVLNMA